MTMVFGRYYLFIFLV